MTHNSETRPRNSESYSLTILLNSRVESGVEMKKHIRELKEGVGRGGINHIGRKTPVKRFRACHRSPNRRE